MAVSSDIFFLISSVSGGQGQGGEESEVTEVGGGRLEIERRGGFSEERRRGGAHRGVREGWEGLKFKNLFGGRNSHQAEISPHSTSVVCRLDCKS